MGLTDRRSERDALDRLIEAVQTGHRWALLSGGSPLSACTAKRSTGWAIPGCFRNSPARTFCTGSDPRRVDRPLDARRRLRAAHNMLGEDQIARLTPL
jgi:hypothetical protein